MVGKLKFGKANDFSLIKNHAIPKNMTLYKHLVYANFVSFIRQYRNCYLKDTWEFFSTLHLAKSNLWIGYTLRRGIRFSLWNWFTTILHGDVRV